jgi:RNA polymerase sigma-70 factor (ECF subfamily)
LRIRVLFRPRLPLRRLDPLPRHLPLRPTLRAGDFQALVSVLDPDVVITADAAAQPVEAMREIRGAENWAKGAIAAARGARAAQPALIDGTVGLVIAPKGLLFRALRFTLAHDKAAYVGVIGHPDRLRQLSLADLAP